MRHWITSFQWLRTGPLYKAGHRLGRENPRLPPTARIDRGIAVLKDGPGVPSVRSGARLLVYFWIAVGSALGGVARFWLSGFVADRIGQTFPWGTIIVNVTGSFVIGFFGTLTGPDGRVLVGSTARQFVMIGICGGYTTFSSFSLQTLTLAQDGEWLWAGANIALSVVLCLLAVWLGHVAAVALNGLKGA
jgi:CrcB protein